MNKENLIEHYFSKTLTEETQKAFNHLMETDPDFAKAVAFEKNLKTVIAKEEQTQLKERFQALDNTAKSALKNTGNPYLKWAIAAVIIILLAIPSFWIYQQNNVSNQALYASHFEPYKNVVHPIVRGQDTHDLMSQAFIAYEAKNYELALKHFNTILKYNPDTVLYFYKANALLYLDKNKEAITILSDTKNISENFKAQQLWYLALAYIKTESNLKAATTLKALISNGTFKKQEAEKLLKQIN
ncbi:tetratricopeptide repeat protein [Bizionia sp.]|uniref:tetratricopeptide repeat protein n=1 Tax=Bizionia sp. TaxID=1954480 RepID=UPI003A904CDE